MGSRVFSMGNNRSILVKKSVEEKRAEDGEMSCAPACLGRYAVFPVFLVCMCLNAIFQGMMVNGFISTSISSIEKRFVLTSTKSGIFSATYDIAVALVLIPLAIMAPKVNKSKVIGLGMILVGLGAMLLVVPQFTEGNYAVGALKSENCDPTREMTCDEAQTVSPWAFPILLISQVLIGFGAAPLFTYGYSCIDEYDAHERTARNMALFMGVSTVGPAIAFIGGGQLLKIWGDIGKTDYKELGITGSTDPRWYGAWWIGFLAAGVGCFFTSLPLLTFPRKLLDTEERKKNDKMLTHLKLNVDFTGEKWGFLKTFKLFFFNITCMSLVGMQTFESLVMNGYITFIPKLFENLFGYSSSWSATLTGLIVVPMGVLGNYLGGRIVGCIGQKFQRMMKSAIVLSIIVLCCSFVLFLRCEDRNIAGLQSQPYQRFSTINGGAECNSGCNCEGIFNPVCDGESGVSFMSPCHAGCRGVRSNSSHYSQCTCPIADSVSETVSLGWCKANCQTVEIIFFIIFGFMAACIFACGPIVQNASLRVVGFSHRDQFICFSWMFMRVFGSIPGAVLFGYVIDTTCLHWMADCQNAEKCVVYDTHKLSLYTFIFTMVTKVPVVLCQIVAWLTYIPVPDSDDPVELKPVPPESPPPRQPTSLLPKMPHGAVKYVDENSNT